MIRVVIAEDHHLVRDGIRALLERSEDMSVVGEATNGLEAVELVKQTKPDVIVMDVTMPERNGIEATSDIRSSDSATEVVILSMHTEGALVRRALQAGARGYVFKGSVTEELLLAVRSAHRGATYLSPLASESIVDVPGTVAARDDETRLTPREIEVLDLIGDGFTNRAIGKQLGVSIKTVERHRTKIMAKLDAHSIVELMREAFRRGLLDAEG
jgi:DNA-binding NarL/FixJ family response regulator